MKKYYLDTCIWRDYFENREDRFRPLGEWAFRLIKKIVGEGNLILYSELIINELRGFYSEKEIKDIMGIVPSNFLIEVKTRNYVKKAFELSKKVKIPKSDAFHAILAKDNKAVLVTRDKHFHELYKEVTIMKPEDLI